MDQKKTPMKKGSQGKKKEEVQNWKTEVKGNGEMKAEKELPQTGKNPMFTRRFLDPLEPIHMSAARMTRAAMSMRDVQRAPNAFKFGDHDVLKMVPGTGMKSNLAEYIPTPAADTRVESLFSDVWSKVLAPKLQTELSGDLEPLMLKLRLVCRTWRNGIDEYLVNQQPSAQERKIQYRFKEQVKPPTVLSPKQKPSEFLQHFKVSHRSGENPFINKAVLIESELGTLPFYRGVAQMLGMYGNHVLHLGIRTGTPFTTTDPGKCYKNLLGLLNKTRNLQSLNIFFGPHVDESESSSEPSANLNSALQTRIPLLEELRCLTVQGFPSLFLTEVLKEWGNNLQKLVLPFTLVEDDYDLLKLPSLPKLIDVHLFIQDDDRWQKLLLVNWKLERLTLNFVPGAFIAWSVIFEMLESKWGDSLTSLIITLSHPLTPILEDGHKQEVVSGELALNLPQLKRFNVCFRTKYFTLDFMEGMTELEQLTLEVQQAGFLGRWLDEQEVQERILFRGYSYRMMESNIWQKLPRLKTLEVKTGKDTMTYKRGTAVAQIDKLVGN